MSLPPPSVAGESRLWFTAMGSSINVVGVGADGWDSITSQGQAHVLQADVLIGGRRHLALLPDTPALREPWPSPLLAGLDDLLARHAGRDVVVVASGDPMVSGIGTTLIRRLGSGAVRVIPTVSSVALARARMGWAAEDCDTVTGFPPGPSLSTITGIWPFGLSWRNFSVLFSPLSSAMGWNLYANPHSSSAMRARMPLDVPAA